MMIGVSSYSYSRLVNSGAMKQIDVIAKAKEMGFDCIEFSTIAVPEGKTLPEFAAELKAEADRVGIPRRLLGTCFHERRHRKQQYRSLRHACLAQGQMPHHHHGSRASVRI